MATLRDIMSTDVVTVTRRDNIYEAALKMKNSDTGFIPVVENGRPIGVVTDRDLVIRGYAEKRSGSASIEEVMTKGVVSLPPGATVEEAARKMAENRIRRLAVVENDRLVGVVALGDLAVRDAHDRKAGQALSEISKNVDHVGVPGR